MSVSERWGFASDEINPSGCVAALWPWLVAIIVVGVLAAVLRGW